MNDALGVDEQLKILSGKKIRGKKYGTGAYRNVTPKLTAAGLTQKREAFARFMNYLNDEDEDMPRINPKTIDPVEYKNSYLVHLLKILNQDTRIKIYRKKLLSQCLHKTLLQAQVT